MEVQQYVALSGLLSLQRRLDSVANNIANSSTPGYRTEGLSFNSFVSRAGASGVAYATTGVPHYSMASGPIAATGNQFDIAIQGAGFLGVETASGIGYTRDGRLSLSPDGSLLSNGGLPIVDKSGSAIRIAAGRNPIRISRDGTISQGGNRIATLGLFELSPGAALTRHQGALFVSSVPAEPVADYVRSGILQGHLEGSNVNPIIEMTRLIEVSRQYETISAGIDQSQKRFSDALKALGSSR